MSLVEDLERVQTFVSQEGSDEERAWFARWGEAFVEAAGRGDDRACEDLADALMIWERSALYPPERWYTLEEVMLELGFDSAHFDEQVAARRPRVRARGRGPWLD